MKFIKNNYKGFLVTFILAIIASYCSNLIPYHLISASVFSMLLGMALHPVLKHVNDINDGLNYISKKVLKISIIFMGATLSFSQVLDVGKYSLFVMIFTLLTAFGFGNLFGRLFKMNWKLSNLISAGTGICGGSAIAAISPTIDALDSDVAYAISATFIFDIIMVILFPIMGKAFHMTDLGFGLWAGTAVNDTSSVVAAGYAFSDIAGNYAVIVKLTRTLSIIPIVLIFSYINQKLNQKQAVHGAVHNSSNNAANKVNLTKIFPWFILLFLGMVFLKSIGFITSSMGNSLSEISKFLMVCSLGAIGLKTDFKKVASNGLLPMFHGFLISTLVVIVSFLVQRMVGQM